MTADISSDFVDRAVHIAHRAGAEIMKIYATDFDVEAKADNSPVTLADRIAESLITDAILREVTDAFPIVGEEAVAAGNIPDVSGTPFWLVDALDGTKEFIKRNGEFTVNIGLIESGAPVFGVVHIPAGNVTYWGSPLGAFMADENGAVKPIHVRTPTGGLTAAASRSHRTAEVDEYLRQFHISEEITAGSSLKFCLVAEGKVDIYPRLGRTMEWDTAAGHAVVRFAGGNVKDLKEKELTYGKVGFENPQFVVTGGVEIS